jgi:methionyl-tRNA formyltransferase
LLPEAQDDAQATITRPLVKADGWIDWSRPAREIERHIRAMWDWPRAWTTLAGSPMQVHRAAHLPSNVEGEPGSVLLSTNGALVATGEGSLMIEIAQSAGGKPLDGKLVLDRAAVEGLILGAGDRPIQPETPLIQPAMR